MQSIESLSNDEPVTLEWTVKSMAAGPTTRDHQTGEKIINSGNHSRAIVPSIIRWLASPHMEVVV